MPDPYIDIEPQDMTVENDPTRHHGIIVKEAPLARLEYIGHFVELGRELCNAPDAFEIPIYALCAVMGKDQVCENLGGRARVVWCTNHPADSKVYASVVSDTGPWTLVGSSSSDTYCHDFEFGILALDTKHYFYVESVSSITGATLQGSGIFCSGDIVRIAVSPFTLTLTVTPMTPQEISLQEDMLSGQERYPDFTDDSDLTVPTPGVSAITPVDVAIPATNESHMSGAIKSMTITP